MNIRELTTSFCNKFVTRLLSRNYKTSIKKLQDSYQETTGSLQHSYKERLQHYRMLVSKMIECVSFIPQCATCTVIILAATAHYIYSLLKMAEVSINDLLQEDPPKLDAKRQKPVEYVLTGNSKQYLRKVYTKERINELSEEELSG